MTFYLQYLSTWPDYFAVQDAPCGRMMAYSTARARHRSLQEFVCAYILLHGLWLCLHPVMGKAEGKKKNWHGHVTAVTVAPEFRRLGLAKKLMDELERVSDKVYVCSLHTCTHVQTLTKAVQITSGMRATLWTSLCESPMLWPLGCTRSLATARTEECLGTTLATTRTH